MKTLEIEALKKYLNDSFRPDMLRALNHELSQLEASASQEALAYVIIEAIVQATLDELDMWERTQVSFH